VVLVACGGNILAGSKSNIVIIVAGGSGSRYGSLITKQYTNSILRKTILKFLSNDNIDDIQVVIQPKDLELYKSETKNLRLLPVVFGGENRSESVKQGIIAIKQYKPNLVLIHDANRPFISTNLINKIIKNLISNPNNAVIPCLKINEELIECWVYQENTTWDSDTVWPDLSLIHKIKI
jgi:2-C-methyl-D-erythritol 4-phosphate cytidylyltransferase/2-C-methyl-D-erythritol 2,4-cyclodiphosphate synthase